MTCGVCAVFALFVRNLAAAGRNETRCCFTPALNEKKEKGRCRAVTGMGSLLLRLMRGD